jgi:hypothetical protein
MAGTYNPGAFYEIATEMVAKEPDEMRFRAAVSMTYYGAFLLARKAVNLDSDSSPNVHFYVREAISRERIRVKLQTLHQLRKAADYEEIPRRQGHRDWQRNWREACLIYELIAPEFEKYIRDGHQ